MNRGQRRAHWQARIRRENAAGRGDWPAVIVRQPGAGTMVRRQNPASTQLRINELVLRGFDNSSARRIASAFERELTSLLQTHALPARWRGNPMRARTNPVRLRSLTDARGIGEQLARAVFALQADDHGVETKR